MAPGWSPAGASIEFLTARGLSKMPQQGIHAVTVPGAVSGWMALHEKFGKATLETIESRRLTFRVAVSDARGLVAAGRITRVVVDRDRFLEKAAGGGG